MVLNKELNIKNKKIQVPSIMHQDKRFDSSKITTLNSNKVKSQVNSNDIAC